jgi:hypothetical protein
LRATLTRTGKSLVALSELRIPQRPLEARLIALRTVVAWASFGSRGRRALGPVRWARASGAGAGTLAIAGTRSALWAVSVGTSTLWTFAVTRPASALTIARTVSITWTVSLARAFTITRAFTVTRAIAFAWAGTAWVAISFPARLALGIATLRAKFVGSDFSVAILVEAFKALDQFSGVNRAVAVGVEQLEDARRGTSGLARLAAFGAIGIGTAFAAALRACPAIGSISALTTGSALTGYAARGRQAGRRFGAWIVLRQERPG